MSITTTGNRITYTGNGVTTVFAFPYLFLANTDIVVIVDGVTQTTGFTVTGAGDPNGGNVAYLSAPAVGALIILYRDPDLLQQTVLSPNDPFPAKTVERMSDKLTLLIQRLFELSGRSIRLSDADVTTTSTSLPSPVANNLIGWNSSNTGLQNVDPATFSGLITYGTWTAQTFDGDGVTTDFVLASDPSSAANVDCAIGGVVKRTVIDYAIVSPNTVRITPAPPAGTDNVFFRWGSALPVGVADSVVGQTTIGTQLIQAADVAAVQSIVDSVNKTGAQTKSGVLTFTSSPVVPDPTSAQNPVTLNVAKWMSKGIGEFYVVDDSITGVDIPPTDNPMFRYIKLTAGLTGTGGYNNGCLTSESVTGLAPLVLATAVVSLAGSPMSGQTIDLLNTEERVLRAGTSAGTKLQDAFQGHAFGDGANILRIVGIDPTAGGSPAVFIDATRPPLVLMDDGVNGSPRVANETRMKSLTVTVYQRIL